MSSLDTRAIDDKELKEAPSPKTRQEFRVFLAEAAFDRAVARGTGDTTREIGGVLVGEVLRDAAGPYLRVDTTIDALHADEKGAELTFTHATWDHIHKEMDGKHKDKRVVGWYHTHPGFGVFLSDRDQFIHKSFFNLPFQIALVYDPKSREHGVFTWHDNEVRRARRYFIGEREQTWDGSRAHENPERAAAAASSTHLKAVNDDDHDRDDKPARDKADEPLLPASLTTLVVTAAVLMLVAGFVGHWVGASSGNAALAQAEAELAKAHHEGEQIALSSINSDLVGVLRETLGDQAMHKPIGEAIAAIDAAIKGLEGGTGSGAGSGSGSGSGSGTGTGSGTGSGSGSGTGTGSGSGSAVAASGAGSGSAVAASGTGSGAGSAATLAQLRAARETLARLAAARSEETTLLAALEHNARADSALKADLAHDVAEQRAAMGVVLSELAATTAKTGDKDHAARLLSLAAHLDPGNRARYEQQLRAFDPSASLPPGGTQ